MPFDGQQQVYGAQHPPNLKIIKELKSGSGSSNSHSLPGTVVKAFRDYEKKTIDAWDIDENECFNLTDPFQISITDSEEVAKKIIKNHKETQEKMQSSVSIGSKTTTKLSPGPGKALRQETDANSQISNLSKSFKITSLSSSDVKSTDSSYAKPSDPKSSIQNKKNDNQDSNASNRHQLYVFKDFDQDSTKIQKFENILNSSPINLSELEKLSWKGIPNNFRPICWKLLSDYLPLKKELQEKTIEQKRNSYWESVTECYSPSFLDLNHDTLRQILNDIPRMNPLIPIFQNETVQNIFQRVLYVWAVRHPGSGYVQGINDLLTPFFVVFLNDYIKIASYTEIEAKDIENLSQESLHQLEADCYWCMTKLLDRIQENYIFSQPGIQKKIIALEELMKRIDRALYEHLKKNNIEFIQFAFRWMNNLLMREIPLNCTIRLWDTYHAEPFGFSDFHLYVCAAFLCRYSKNLIEEKDFQGLMLLLQSLPTRNLKISDITLLTAEAYKLQVMFANSPSHMSGNNL
ncbi:TBC1 domain family member 22B [Brachionus plicatilis]|uniref:TBC1 domain family member 22B n=1 Tax=Brachionus plicatilis TaxID=10195 RepID=A0A3M7P7C7_BRAPC|nr:TBC1 domain family member 22B [Brachionus plicatilis]